MRWFTKAAIAVVLLWALATGIRWLSETQMDANARRNPVFQQALAILNASPLAETVLGKPIHTVGHVHEVAEESGAVGHSAMDIALAGSKGRAMLYVRSSKSDGDWTIEEIALQKEGDPHWVPLQKP